MGKFLPQKVQSRYGASRLDDLEQRLNKLLLLVTQ